MKRLLGLALLLVACGDTTVTPTAPTEHPQPGSFQASQVRAQVGLAPASGFADQTGGGVFVGASGQAVRLRLDGTRAALEGHPGNPVAPGAARGVWRLGPRSALVEADNGLFLADSGWLIAPPWRGALGPGLVASAQAADGAVWLAHGTSGLFRLVDGQLAAFKAGGAVLDGIGALAAAPAEDGAPGVWLLRGGQLSVVVPTGPGAYQVRAAGPPLDEGEALLSLAALGPGPQAPGELWVLTSARLLRRTPEGWRRVEFTSRPLEVHAAGRFAWVRVGEALLLHDAEAGTWAAASGLGAGEVRVLAVDESGCAWVRTGTDTLAVSRAPVPRVSGLLQGSEVVEDALVLRALLPPGAEPLNVAFELGGTRVPVQAPHFSMGGVDAEGAFKPYSLAALTAGRHTLDVVAVLPDGSEARRRVPFEYRPLSTAVLSWERDVRPLHVARCEKCHVTGPGRPLATYTQWKENAALIAEAVKDQRMPADGPMDPQQISLIQRWVAAGAQP